MDPNPEQWLAALKVVEAARRFEAAEQAYHHLVRWSCGAMPTWLMGYADGCPAARQVLRTALAAYDAVLARVDRPQESMRARRAAGYIEAVGPMSTLVAT